MKRIQYLIFFLALFIIPDFCNAQDIEMADLMRSNGKIYVVVAVVTVVLVGMIVYISLLDKKVRQIEKDLDRKEQ